MSQSTVRTTGSFRASASIDNDTLFKTHDVTISVDIDRIDWITADVVIGPISDTVLAALDPRTDFAQLVTVEMSQTTDAGASLGGRSETLVCRSVQVDYLADTITVRAASSESLLRDAIHAATTPLDTGQTTLRNLVDYAIQNAYTAGLTLTDRISAGSVSIPAGDRRMLMPGESYWDLIEQEVNAAGGRLYFTNGLPELSPRNDPPRDRSISGVTLYTHGPEATVTSLTQTLDRDGDWANAIVVQYDYQDTNGDRITSYQAATPPGGSPQQTRGSRVDYDRAPSSSNLATQIRDRALTRGREFEVTARIDFTVVPGLALTIDRPTGPMQLGMIRSVEYRLSDGEMTIRSQIGQPIE